MIFTDVAARGIDISGLPYLINMTLPDRSEDYVHRVGRVGEPMKPTSHESCLSVSEVRQRPSSRDPVRAFTSLMYVGSGGMELSLLAKFLKRLDDSQVHHVISSLRS